MRLTYQNYMELLKNAWNYTYHNTANNIVEPYPEDVPPSKITQELKLTSLTPNLPIILKHADHIFNNKHLKHYKPYLVEFTYNNSKPYRVELYAQNKRAAKHLSISRFSDYLKSVNSSMYKVASINMLINNGKILCKLIEI